MVSCKNRISAKMATANRKRAVIVHPSIKTEEARNIFPKMNVVKPYLRFTPLPKEETSANV